MMRTNSGNVKARFVVFVVESKFISFSATASLCPAQPLTTFFASISGIPWFFSAATASLGVILLFGAKNALPISVLFLCNPSAYF